MRTALACLLLALAIAGFYWKLTLTRQYTWLDSPDIGTLEAPRFQFQARAWHAGEIPLWDPTQWCGQPLAGQMTGALYPLNWPWYWLAGRSPRVSQGMLHWYFVWMHLFAALNAYALARWLGRSHVAAGVAGLVFAVGAFLATNDWPPLLNGAAWAPLVFLFLLRSAGGRRPLASAAWCGVALGMAWLSGHHEPPLYITLAAAGVWTWQLARQGWRLLPRAAVCGVTMALVAALQVLPAQEFGRLAVRWAGAPDVSRWKDAVPYTVHTAFSLTPASLAGIVLPGAFEHGNPYLGFAALGLAALGAAAMWREQAVRLFTVVAVAAVLLALGGWNVLHGLLYAVLPLMEKARVPARAVVLFGCAAALLAAYGYDALRSAAGEGARRKLAWGLGAAAVFLNGVLLFRKLSGLPVGDERFYLAGLLALLAAVLLRRSTALALIVVAVMELGSVAQWGFPSLADPERPSLWKQLHAHDDVAQFLLREPRPLRVEVDDAAFAPNFGQWYGIETLGGFASGVTANIFDTLHWDETTRNLLAVTHYVGKARQRPGQELAYESPGGLKVYRNPGAMPRARVAEGTARVTAQSATRVEVEAELARGGMVVLADTYFPGWTATVDGAKAEVVQVEGALRGVAAEAGRHHIVYRYRPASVYFGALLAALGLMVAVGLSCFEGRFAR